MSLFAGPKEFGFTAGKHHFTPIYEESKYKYLVYVDGHCAACRYGFMMRLGSVILKVDPRQVADRMWYFPLLKPYHDHIPVKADLSDLEEKIAWCRAHDEECRQIAENAKRFFDTYVARTALLDYIEMVCKHINKRYMNPPSWWQPPRKALDPPQLDVPCYEDRQSGQSRLCTRCQEEYEAEMREMEEVENRKRNRTENAMEKKMSHRERIKKKAALKKQKLTKT